MPASGPSDSNSGKSRDKDERLVKRGERFAAIRERAGYASRNKACLSIAGMVDQATLGGVENGTKDINLSTAERIADAYGVSLDVLVGREPIPEFVDRFPKRAVVVASEEFKAAPEPVQKRLTESLPVGAEKWSAVRWAKELLDLCAHWERWKTLPPVPTVADAPDSTRRFKPR